MNLDESQQKKSGRIMKGVTDINYIEILHFLGNMGHLSKLSEI